ncbi:MAG: hypothetical protein F4Y63_08030 [Chloroflexi bacterium]|nr:hypothetical protein [Chloroflexota bacterium]MYK62456.1 hypothetical protein [Chloroflexota bacterium]
MCGERLVEKTRFVHDLNRTFRGSWEASEKRAVAYVWATRTDLGTSAIGDATLGRRRVEAVEARMRFEPW